MYLLLEQVEINNPKGIKVPLKPLSRWNAHVRAE